MGIGGRVFLFYTYFQPYFTQLHHVLSFFCNDKVYNFEIVRDKFLENVGQSERQFLLTRDFSEEGRDLLVAQAALLDSKGFGIKSKAEIKRIDVVKEAESAVGDLVKNVKEFLKSETEAREKEKREFMNEMRQMQVQMNQFMNSRLDSAQQMTNSAQGAFDQSSQVNVVSKKEEKQAKKVDKKPKTGRREPCYNCGSLKHATENCTGAGDVVCYLCGQKGHFSMAKKFHGPGAKNE